MLQQSGFNLVELMMVLVIVAILSAIAVPSYQHIVDKSRKSEAQSALLEFSQAMERLYTIEGGYESAVDPGNGKVPNEEVFLARVSEFYYLEVEHADAESYELRAVPSSHMHGGETFILHSSGKQSFISYGSSNKQDGWTTY